MTLLSSVLSPAKMERLRELQQQVGQWGNILDRRDAWLRLLADLQGRLGQTDDVWLESLRVQATAPTKLRLVGHLLDPPPAPPGGTSERSRRFRQLLAGLMESPYVLAIEGEHFESDLPGALKFEVVVVVKPGCPL